MNIYIPTRGRVGNQLTLDAIRKHAPSWYPRTWLVASEKHDYPRVLLHPEHKTISERRQWISELSDAGIMADDDIRFSVRDNTGRLVPPSGTELEELFNTMERHMSQGYGMSGISMRHLNRAYPHYNFVECKAIFRIWACRFDLMRKHNIAYDDVDLFQDIHVNLSLMKAGYKNIVDYRFAEDNAGRKGGCFIYRTEERRIKSARLLEERHPGIYVVKSWDPLKTIVYWTKAYESSLSG